jgi:predicted phage terminase large subunit-like protein
MIKYDWFQYFDRNDPPAFDRIVQSWDTASKPGNISDYSVCTTWGIANQKFHLLNVYRERVGYPDLKRAVVEQAIAFEPDTILIEDHSSGTALIQDMIAEGLHNIVAYKPVGNKIMRMHTQTATIKNGFVFVPTQAHWVGDYLHELTSFYFAKYDDQVDSTSQFLDWAKVIEPYIITHARQEAERRHRPARATILVQKPTNSPGGTIYFADGTHANVSADGTVRIRPEDFGPLNQQGWTRIE